MVEPVRRHQDFTPPASVRDALVVATLVAGLLLLIAPPALQAFALLTASAALAAWKLSGWLEQWPPEERDEDARRGW
jgi:hypothetical protein